MRSQIQQEMITLVFNKIKRTFFTQTFPSMFSIISLALVHPFRITISGSNMKNVWNKGIIFCCPKQLTRKRRWKNGTCKAFCVTHKHKGKDNCKTFSLTQTQKKDVGDDLAFVFRTYSLKSILCQVKWL